MAGSMYLGFLWVPALLPIVGGMILLFLSHFGPLAKGWEADRRLEIYVMALTLVNSLVLAWLIAHFGNRERLVLFRLFGDLTVMFCLDGMGRVFAGIIAFLWPLAVLYSFEYMKGEERRSTFFSYYLMTYGVTSGIAMAGNMTTLYLFYELLTLVTFPLVLYPMTREAVRASRRYLYYSIGGAAFAFIGLVFILSFSVSGTTEFVAGGALDLVRANEKRNTLLFVYVLAFFGFGVKAALFPCHGWLPKATVAPTPVTALLHAVAVVKSGAFAILRLTYFSFGTAFLKGSWAQWTVLCAAMLTIIYGSTMAVKEAHWKRRLAYSTISNLSYILMGAVMMSPLGLVAALSHMVFHALMKICSFFCAGAVMHQTGKTHIYELDGLAKQMPKTFACLTIASLSLVGIPPFAGFISKWNIAQAAFELGLGQGLVLEQDGGLSWLGLTAVAVLLYSALMTAVYMLTVAVRAYFPQFYSVPAKASVMQQEKKPEKAGQQDRKSTLDPNWMMLGPLIIFAVLILGFGLHAQPFMDLLMRIGGEAG